MDDLGVPAVQETSICADLDVTDIRCLIFRGKNYPRFIGDDHRWTGNSVRNQYHGLRGFEPTSMWTIPTQKKPPKGAQEKLEIWFTCHRTAILETCVYFFGRLLQLRGTYDTILYQKHPLPNNIDQKMSNVAGKSGYLIWVATTLPMLIR